MLRNAWASKRCGNDVSNTAYKNVGLEQRLAGGRPLCLSGCVWPGTQETDALSTHAPARTFPARKFWKTYSLSPSFSKPSPNPWSDLLRHQRTDRRRSMRLAKLLIYLGRGSTGCHWRIRQGLADTSHAEFRVHAAAQSQGRGKLPGKPGREAEWRAEVSLTERIGLISALSPEPPAARQPSLLGEPRILLLKPR